MRDTTSKQVAAPWGSLAALLSACLATLAGVVRGIDPDVILWRAAATATIIGSLIAVVACVMRFVHRES